MDVRMCVFVGGCDMPDPLTDRINGFTSTERAMLLANAEEVR